MKNKLNIATMCLLHLTEAAADYRENLVPTLEGKLEGAYPYKPRRDDAKIVSQKKCITTLKCYL